MDEENYLELLEIESALKEEFKDCPDVKAFSNKTKEEDFQSENEASYKIFNCLECDKTFSRAEYLRRHKITHTGEKRYTCAKCDMRFANRSYLKKHELIHTGEMPFECSTCNKRFRQAGTLKIHVRRHTCEKTI